LSHGFGGGGGFFKFFGCICCACCRLTNANHSGGKMTGRALNVAIACCACITSAGCRSNVGWARKCCNESWNKIIIIIIIMVSKKNLNKLTAFRPTSLSRTPTNRARFSNGLRYCALNICTFISRKLKLIWLVTLYSRDSISAILSNTKRENKN